MNQIYLDTARLLTQVAPIVFADGVFALTGPVDEATILSVAERIREAHFYREAALQSPSATRDYLVAKLAMLQHEVDGVPCLHLARLPASSRQQDQRENRDDVELDVDKKTLNTEQKERKQNADHGEPQLHDRS
jgi:hypothetical protein